MGLAIGSSATMTLRGISNDTLYTGDLRQDVKLGPGCLHADQSGWEHHPHREFLGKRPAFPLRL